MRILFDVGHPAHVHLFRHAIKALGMRGHVVLVTASDKDVTVTLLQQLGIPFIPLGPMGQTVLSKGIGLFFSSLKLALALALFRPDILVAVSPVRAAPLAWASGRPCIGFDDTEHARLARRLYRPFVSVVLTPSWYSHDLGHTQIRYDGLHEIAYLHPKYLVPDPTVLSQEGLQTAERFSVVRFVSVSAIHDHNHHGFGDDMKEYLVGELSKCGRVIISSEAALPASLGRYRMRSPATAMHHLLAFASLCVGDAGTVATEAAVLGTPSVFFGSVGGEVGHFRELEHRYGLLRCFSQQEAAIDCSVALLRDPSAKSRWMEQKKAFVSSCIDLTDSIVRLVETAGSDRRRFSVQTATQIMKMDATG